MSEDYVMLTIQSINVSHDKELKADLYVRCGQNARIAEFEVNMSRVDGEEPSATECWASFFDLDERRVRSLRDFLTFILERSS